MKKLLIASTALSLAGGAAFAEISISGDAELGVDYNSEPGMTKSKHTFVHEVGIDFSGSGTTDGGLTFGGSAGFDTGDDVVNTGTVHVSGSFGTLTIGDNDAADLTAGGIADIGMNGIGVDDMVEGLRGGTAAALRYDNDFGQIKISISAGTKDGEMTSAAVDPVDAMPGIYRHTIGGSTGTMGLGNLVHAADPESLPDVDGTAYQAAVVAHVLGLTEVGDTLEVDGAAINFSHDGAAADVDLSNYRLGGTGEDPADDEDGEILYQIDGSAAGDTVTAAHVAAWKALADAYGVAEDGGLDAASDGITSTPTPGDPVVVVEHTPEVEAEDAVYSKSETEYAFGMNFEAGGVTIGVGYDSNKTVSMGAGFSAGEITTNLLYVKRGEEHADGEATGLGADMSYTMGASTVTLAYGRNTPEGKDSTDAVGMGVTHDLGGGATMNAGFGKVDESNKASIGLMFKF